MSSRRRLPNPGDAVHALSPVGASGHLYSGDGRSSPQAPPPGRALQLRNAVNRRGNGERRAHYANYCWLINGASEGTQAHARILRKAGALMDAVASRGSRVEVMGGVRWCGGLVSVPLLDDEGVWGV